MPVKRKLLVSAYSLETGGIETSLINFLKIIPQDFYEITLLLQEKKGTYLKQIPKHIKIEEYRLSKQKNRLLRKITNRLHLLAKIITNYQKYEIAIHYATYDIPSSILTRYLGKKQIFWVHSDYTKIMDTEAVRSFFMIRKITKFQKIVFVSNEAKNSLLTVIPEVEEKSVVINNIIDVLDIKNKSEEALNIAVPKSPIFLFIGRLEEESKRVSRLLDAFALQEEGHLWIVGDGLQREAYEQHVADLGIADKVTFFGNTDNPYTYLKAADCLVLTSEYEGFPVVILEALALEKPIISTIPLSVNDFSLKKHAVIVSKDIKNIATAMSEIIQNSPETFDYIIENDKNKQKILDMLEMK